MFGFGKKIVKPLTTTGLKPFPIKGYTPNPDNFEMHVFQIDDLTVLKGRNPKKSHKGISALYLTASIRDEKLVPVYGPEIIVVSKKFASLSVKQQLAAVMMENYMNGSTVDIDIMDFNTDDSIKDTSVNRRVASELLAAQKYGYRNVRKVVFRQTKTILNSEKISAKWMYKQVDHKAKTVVAPVSESFSSTLTDKIHNDLINPVSEPPIVEEYARA